MEGFDKREEENLKVLDEMVGLADTYNKWIQEEMKKTK